VAKERKRFHFSQFFSYNSQSSGVVDPEEFISKPEGFIPEPEGFIPEPEGFIPEPEV
jgi:hypothetical protein